MRSFCAGVMRRKPSSWTGWIASDMDRRFYRRGGWSGMDVLREPAVRQLGPDSRRARLAQDEGAGGGELQAGADVVHEAGDLAVATPPLGAAAEKVGEIGKLFDVHGSVVPPAALALVARVRRALHDVVEMVDLAAGAEQYAVASLQHLGIDLLALDAAHVHAGPQPFRVDHAHHRRGGRGDHVRAVYARLRRINREDFHPVGPQCLFHKTFPAFLSWAVDAHLAEPAYRERRGELRSRLPAAADER